MAEKKLAQLKATTSLWKGDTRQAHNFIIKLQIFDLLEAKSYERGLCEV